MKLLHFLGVLVIAIFASALPFDGAESSGDARLKTVYQFPNETWVENIAVRADGKLLVTLITTAEVYLIDPFSQTAELVYHFPNATSGLGIAELKPDVFIVAIGDWDPATFLATPGSWSVWSIDFRNCGHRQHSHGAKVHKITNIPEANFLNGMTALPTQKDTVLIADSGKGVIYNLNVESREYFTAIDSPGLKPNASAKTQVGVNGIHYRQVDHESFLYFTNSFQAPVLGRIPLHRDGTAAGPYEAIVDHATYPLNIGGLADDFAFDNHGNAWITTDPTATLLKVGLVSGDVKIVAGGVNSTVLSGDTAAAFGRTRKDKETLYVTTNGGIPFPQHGVVGAKVIALDTKGL